MPSASVEDDKLSRRNFLKFTGAASAGVALAGCTGDSGGGTTETTTTTTGGSGGDTTTTEDAGGSMMDNELVGLIAKTLVALDPHKVVDDYSILTAVNTYDGFLTLGTSGRPVANAATEWTTEDEGQTFVFTIRDDLKSHAGNDITAEDVVYSANRYKRIGRGYSSLWQGFWEAGNIEARDDTTVAFELNEPFGPFLATAALLFIVDTAVVKEEQQDGDFGENGDYGQAYLSQNTAGTGPYELTSWQQGSELIFEAFEDHWRGWESNQFGKVRNKIVLEESTQRQMMKQGDGDFCDPFLSPEAYEDMANSDRTRHVQEPANWLYEFPINCQKAPMDDIKVREACALAFDYQTAINDIMLGSVPAKGPCPVVMPGSNENISPVEQDMEAAQAALDESSYTVDEINDIGIEILWVSSAPIERKLSLLLSENLGQLGITNIEINGQAWATLTDRAASVEETPHFANIYHTAKYASPDQYTFAKYHPDSAGSWVSMNWYHDDEELNEACLTARRDPNTDSRYTKYKEAQQLAANAHPSIFVSNPAFNIVFNKNIGGWQYRGGLTGFQRQFYYMTRTGDGRA